MNGKQEAVTPLIERLGKVLEQTIFGKNANVVEKQMAELGFSKIDTDFSGATITRWFGLGGRQILVETVWEMDELVGIYLHYEQQGVA